MLWVAAALAFIADVALPGQGMSTLGAAVLGVIALNAAFSFLQERRAGRAIASLRAMLPLHVKAFRDGGVAQLPASEVVPGDVVLLERGDHVPADARVLSASALAVSTAALTGESVSEPRDAAASDAPDPEHAGNCVLAGTFVVAGHGRVAVYATGGATALARIARMTRSAHDAPAPLQVEIQRIARVVALLATVIGAACFAIGLALGAPVFASMMFAIGIIVANVPEGLLPTVTLSLALASQRMARRNALVRRLAAVEALGSATVICTDKTGTLTQNRMTVAEVFAGGATLPDVRTATLAAFARGHPSLFEAALLCHDVRETRWKGTVQLAGDPAEVALYRAALDALGHGAGGRREAEIPFDWGRRRSSTVHRTRAGLTLHAKGAPESILPVCTSIDTGAGAVALTGGLRRAVADEANRMAAAGLRVFAFARRALRDDEPRSTWETDLVLAGLIGLEDPVRPEVAGAVQRCREAGIRVVMVTGDHPATARAVAAACGVTRSRSARAVLGEELATLDDVALERLLAGPEVLFARVDPADKLRIVQALQRRGEIVAVTGDGVNDAPALRAAHIGVAMGLSGTDVAREAADLVLTDDNFATIVSAVEEGRAVFANTRKFMTYILTSNVPELVPYLAFALLNVPVGLTILQILAVDLGTDMLPALGLGAERPSPELMRGRPRAPTRRLLDRSILLRAYGWLGPLEAAGAMGVFLAVLTAGGWRWGDMPAWTDPTYRAATTACLATIIVMQVVNVLICRSETEPAARSGRLPLMIGAGIAAELALLVVLVYTPAGHVVFATAPFAPWVWLAAAACALAMLVLEESRKLLVRRWRDARLAVTPPSRSSPAAHP